MHEFKIQELIQHNLPDAQIEITGDGHHFQAQVVSSLFDGKSRIERQRIVYQSVEKFIHSGELHALSIKTFTPEEWQRLNNGNKD